MRPLEEVMKDLTAAANDVKSKQDKLDKLSKAQSEAFNEVEEAKKKTYELRTELETFLNLLVPSSQQDRVRVSG